MSRRSRLVIAACVVAVACLGPATIWLVRDGEALRGYRARTEYPRIVLVTFDTLNVWYTSLYSDDPTATPNLQALADTGVLFEQARTVVPLTLPSHTTLLSGRMPWDARVMKNGDHVPDSVRTLPEILSELGYRTAAFVSLGVVNPPFNLDQGFDEYDPVPVKKLGRWYRTAAEVIPRALSWMDQHADESFFVWIHLSDPHGPFLGQDAPPDTELLLDGSPLGQYTLGLQERHTLKFELPPGSHRLEWRAIPGSPGDPVEVLEMIATFDLGLWTQEDLPTGRFERNLEPSWGVDLLNPGSKAAQITLRFGGHPAQMSTRWMRTRYREEVARADRGLGEIRRFLSDRGLEKGTLWWVASDHGEGLGYGGSYGHAAFNREEQLRTLLLFSGPGVPAGRRLASPPVLLVDGPATLLNLLGLDPPEGIEGRSLVQCWRPGGCAPPRKEWLAYGVGRGVHLRTSAFYRWPLKALWTRRNRSGIFDLSKDPREREPLRRLPRSFDQLRVSARSLPAEQASLVMPLARQIEVLRSLLAEAPASELGAEQKEMLHALGYL